MNLKETLIKKYNAPLTFIGYKPEEAEVPEYPGLKTYQFSDIKNIVVVHDNLTLNIDGGYLVTLGTPISDDTNTISRILYLSVLSDEGEYNTEFNLESNNVLVISTDDTLTLSLIKLSNDLLPLINGNESLLSNYPLISYETKFIRSSILEVIFKYEDTPIDFPRVINTIHFEIDGENNIQILKEIDRYYEKYKKNRTNISSIYNTLSQDTNLLLIFNGAIYRVSYIDSHVILEQIIVNDDYSIDFKDTKIDVFDIIDKCNIVKVPQYISYNNVILNNNFEVIDVKLQNINSYYSMKDQIDTIDNYCNSNSNSDIEDNLVEFNGKLLEKQYSLFKDKKYYKDDTIIISNGRVISTKVFNNIIEKYIQAIHDSINKEDIIEEK